MDIRSEIAGRKAAILREHGGEWLEVCEALLLRVEGLESRVAMYEAASAYDAKADVEKKEIDDLAVGVDTSAEEAPAAICPKKKMAKLPNGKTCVTCGKNLHGQQRRFCSNSCSNSYSYLSTRHPEATPVEIKTLVAGSGWQDAGKKRRKYRSFDAEKAEKNRLRASMSRVPDLV